MHVGLQKPEHNLTNADIAGSWPKWNKFDTKREPSNPLNPVYKLAHVEYVPPEPPKFIRNSMEIKDIDGARPKFIKELKTRETNLISDIEGSSPKQKKHRKMFGEYSNMNYQDVTQAVKRSSRQTDALNPVYVFRDTMEGDFTRPKAGALNKSYGFIQGQQPSQMYREVVENKGMQTGDIEGA